MNNLTKMAATMAVIVAMLGCMVIVSEDSDAASTIYVGGDGSSDDTGNGTQTAPYATFNKAYSEAASGDTITLNGDVSLSANKTLMKDLTIDLNNHTFDLGSKYILVNTGSTLHVTGSGTIKSTGSYVIYAYGNFTMDSGTLDGSSTDIRANSSAEITLSGTAHVESVMTYTAIFHISINTISSISGSYFGVGSTFNCTFGGDVNENAAPPNMKITGTSGSWSFVPLTMEEDSELIEAYIGNEYYTTLSAALKSLNEGETVTLNRDCTTDETFEVALFRWTLNLNGHSITSYDDYALEITTRYSDDMPATGSLVTIMGSGTSKITAQTPLYIRTGGGEGHVLNFSIEGVELVPSEGYGKIDLGQGVGMLATAENKALLSGAYFESVHSDGTYIYQAITTALETSIDNKAKLYGNYTGQLNISSVGNWTIDLNGNTVTSGATDESAVDVLGNGCHLTLKNGKLESQTEGITIGIPLSGSQITYDDLSITLDDVDVVASGASAFGIVSNGTSTNIDISILNGSSVTSNSGMAVYFPSTGTLTIQDSIISGVSGVEVRKGNLYISGSTSITALGTTYSVAPNKSGTTTSGAAIAISPYESAEVSTMVVSITGGTFTGAVAFSQADPNETENVSFDFSIENGLFTSNAQNESGSTYPAVVAESTTDRFITGGTFKGGDGTDDFVDSVYSINTETGVVFFDDSKVVATVGNDSYASLQEAIDAAQDGDTITLSKNVDESVTFDKDVSVTLDLREFTLGGSDVATALTINAGNVSIIATSGGITGTGNVISVNGADTTLTISSGKITGKNGVVVNEGATVKMTGGSVVASAYALMTPINAQGFGHIEFGGSATLIAAGGIIVTNKSTAVMTGGHIDASVYGIVGNGSFDGTTITISSGTIECDGNAIFHPQEGDITISGGEISGITGLWYSGTGKITISDGTIRSTDTEVRTNPYKPPEQNDGTSFDGAALSIVSRGDNYQSEGKSIIVEITGGTLESVANQAIRDYRFAKADGTWQTNVYSGVEKNFLSELSISGDAKIIAGDGKDVFDADPMSVQNKTYAISGGSFSSDIKDYCVPGFTPVLDPVTGDYVVDVDENVLEVSVESVIGYVVDGVGQTYTVEFSSDLPVVWSTDDEDVATVSNGTITFIGGGDGLATITASVELGNGQILTSYIDVLVYEVPAVAGITFEVVASDDMDGATYNEAMAKIPWEPDNFAMFGISGSDTFTIPYDVFRTFGWPVTSDNYTDYEFVAIHFPTSDRYEFPKVTATADGLTVTVDSHSPFYFFYRLAEVEVEPDLPVIPFPDDDDDYVPLPPHIVYEDEKGSDDSVKIAACAAAAVIAAILAIVLATTYRRR